MRGQTVAIAVLGALLAGSVGGQAGSGSGSSTLSWLPATTYTNGMPMQLASQRLHVARTFETACNVTTPPAPTSFALEATVSAGIATYVDAGLWNGTYYYKAQSVDIFGAASADSNVACKRINITNNWEPPPAGVTPNPPSGLQVQ